MRTTLRNGLLLTTVVAGFAAASSSAMAQTAINGGGSTLAQPTYGTEFTTLNDTSVTWNYAGVGSGKGQGAFLTPDPTLDGYPTGTAVHFGASDAALSETQVSTWNSARAATAGGLIQVPTFGVPVTIPFKDSHITTLKLNDNDLCGIFSGKITNWSGVTAQKVPAGAITVVYRADGSGTTFLTTSHLAQVCNAGNTAAGLTFVPTTTFAGLFGGTPPSNFLGATGSPGVTSAMLSHGSAIAYLSPDYTSIAPQSPTATPLLVASLVNGFNNVAYPPTIANTRGALQNPGPAGHFGTPPNQAAGGNPADPVQWVPIDPNPVKGYPIVGYTTFDIAQCYQNATVRAALKNFLTDQYGAKFANNIQDGGFVPVPASYAAQIKAVLLGNSSGLNLNIGNTTGCHGKHGV